MLGSQFHRCLYQSNSTAMYSQQTVEGFDKKKEPDLILEVGKPRCQSASLELPRARPWARSLLLWLSR